MSHRISEKNSDMRQNQKVTFDLETERPVSLELKIRIGLGAGAMAKVLKCLPCPC